MAPGTEFGVEPGGPPGVAEVVALGKLPYPTPTLERGAFRSTSWHPGDKLRKYWFRQATMMS